MNEVDLKSNPLLQQLSINKDQPQAENELGQDAFLKLMIAQLNNQDPLSPAEGGEFIAQLAQFSSVEGITNLNTAVGDLVNEFRSSRALEASALVGRKVELNSNTGQLPETGTLDGVVELPSSTTRLQVSVRTLVGDVVSVQELSGQALGDVPFSWDGLDADGNRLPSGTYQIQALALVDGESTEVPVRVAANINSVSIGADNNLTLDIDGVGRVPLESVKSFL